MPFSVNWGHPCNLLVTALGPPSIASGELFRSVVLRDGLEGRGAELREARRKGARGLVCMRPIALRAVPIVKTKSTRGLVQRRILTDNFDCEIIAPPVRNQLLCEYVQSYWSLAIS